MKNGFPQPHQYGPGVTRWSLSDIVAYEARVTGRPTPEIPPESDQLLRDIDVARRFGVSRVTPWRWARGR